MIVIIHTLKNGTLVYGTRRGDGTGKIFHDGGFRPSENLPDHDEHGPAFWYVPHSQRNHAKAWLIRQVVAALAEAGVAAEVHIDNVTLPTTPYAEFEEADTERAEGRRDRLESRAAKAVARGEATRERTRDEASRRPFGQPILRGHHSERGDRAQLARWNAADERAFSDIRNGEAMADRAEGVGRRLEQRESLPTTLRRIDKLETRTREYERAKVGASPEYARAVDSVITMRREEIAYWRAHVAALEAETGVKVWGPDDFKKGDYLVYWGGVSEVIRVSAKSVTVPWWAHGQGVKALSVEYAKKNAHHEMATDRVTWDKVKGRYAADDPKIVALLAEQNSPE